MTKNNKIRLAKVEDADSLSKLRIIVDSETLFLDREPGEGVLTTEDFKERLYLDTKEKHHVCYVAEVDNQVVGYVRCSTNGLKRFEHQVSLGICIKKAYWGQGLGKAMMEAAIKYCDDVGIEKISLIVVESNNKAFDMYKKLGFETEGILKKDRRYIDGTYDNTIMMARFNK